MDFTYLIEEITRGFTNFTWGNAVMILVGLVLIALAVIKEYEPVLLLPIGFGCIMANIGMSTDVGFMKVIYDAGIKTELFPLLIFVGVGAMIDFSPLLAQPKMVLLGAAGQFGIYGAASGATRLTTRVTKIGKTTNVSRETGFGVYSIRIRRSLRVVNSFMIGG